MSGVPFVISAPSGTGKTTVCKRLMKDANMRFSVSHTTRPPREGEVDGRDYHFVDKTDFQSLVEDGAFLEHAVYTGNHYGTSYAAIQDSLNDGFDVLLEIEVQGAGQVRNSDVAVRFIFLLPPSMAVLEQRLRDRGTDSEEIITKRLREASSEIDAAKIFDYAVVNDDLDRTVNELREIIEAERTGETGAVRERCGLANVLDAWIAQTGSLKS